MNDNKKIDISNLTGDFLGGLTAAVVALPLALAFGLLSGMGAIAGLYGAIAIGIIAAWFGGTRAQISGPTGPMTVVSSVVIANAIEIHGGSIETSMGSIITIFLLSGVFQIVFGLFKIGQHLRHMPYSVISSFISGIGVIIIALQIFPILGHTSPKKITDIFVQFPSIANDINSASVMLALATIAMIYLFPLISKKIPGAIVALIFLSLVSTLMGLDVKVIGDIPAGLPSLQLNSLVDVNWSNPMSLLIPALTLAALGSIDSLRTSIIADNLSKTRHNSNQELIAQGLGNLGAAMIGGIPGAGASMRTVVNIKSGGKTRLSGVIHGLVLCLVLLGAGGYARFIPLPLLAGILVAAGIGIIDFKCFKHILHIPRVDASIMLIVLIMTVFVDLFQAVAVGMMLTCLLFMKKMADIAEHESATGSVEQFACEEVWGEEVSISEKVRK